MQEPNQNLRISTLREIALYFLKLGATGFGGPLALIAQMERDLADKWMPREQFAQVFAAIKSLPGPVAFQMAVFIGHERGRTVNFAFLGASLAAITLIFPSALLMTLLALSHSTWAGWSWTASVSTGIQAAALGIILATALPLLKSAVPQGKTEEAMRRVFILFGFTITLIRPSLEPVAILVCGILCLRPAKPTFASTSVSPHLLSVPAGMIGLSALDIHVSLFATCFKAGAFVFGSGIAIIPILGSEFVDRLHWMTQAEFLEALTFGQVTPGPLVITATYIGARVAGPLGAVVATFAIFLAPFIHMTTWFPRVWRIVAGSEQWKRFSFGAISCVVGAIAASVIKLLEPAALLAMETERFGANRNVIQLSVWLLFPVGAFVVVHRRLAPTWTVIFAGGFIAWFVMLAAK